MIVWQLSAVFLFAFLIFQGLAFIFIKEEWNPIWGTMVGLSAANLVASFII